MKCRQFTIDFMRIFSCWKEVIRNTILCVFLAAGKKLYGIQQSKITTFAITNFPAFTRFMNIIGHERAVSYLEYRVKIFVDACGGRRGREITRLLLEL
jgi:hypothetical protein